MASGDDFFVLRRFGSVSARVALYLQDQIALLEEQLHVEDENCRQAPKLEERDCGTFRFDFSRRGEILEALATCLERYRKHPVHGDRENI